MNPEAEDISPLHTALVEGWGLPEETQVSLDRLLAALAERVAELLARDTHKLSTAMYTLDIDELRFRDAMHLPTMDMKAVGVAELILERELQKIVTRRRYEEMKTAARYEETSNAAQDEDDSPPTPRESLPDWIR